MSHDVKPIQTDAEFDAALAEVERLWGSKKGTPEGDRFGALCDAIEAYEDIHYPMPFGEPDDPIEAIIYQVEYQGLTREDLEPMIGPAATVAAILKRERPLTAEMVRRLEEGLGLSAEKLSRAAGAPPRAAAIPAKTSASPTVKKKAP